jgi:hypothetical protein
VHVLLEHVISKLLAVVAGLGEAVGAVVRALDAKCLLALRPVHPIHAASARGQQRQRSE